MDWTVNQSRFSQARSKFHFVRLILYSWAGSLPQSWTPGWLWSSRLVYAGLLLATTDLQQLSCNHASREYQKSMKVFQEKHSWVLLWLPHLSNILTIKARAGYSAMVWSFGHLNKQNAAWLMTFRYNVLQPLKQPSSCHTRTRGYVKNNDISSFLQSGQPAVDVETAGSVCGTGTKMC